MKPFLQTLGYFLISWLMVSQGHAANLPFMDKTYALNCASAPHEIIYFISTEKYGIVSLYPEKTRSASLLSITGSAWGKFSHQNGKIFYFQKDNQPEKRAIWSHSNQLALVLGNGQFREGQKFYELCLPESAASKYVSKDGVLERAFARFEEFEKKMTAQKKSSDCYIYDAARQSCASAGSFERCMSIRWGDDWLSKEARCK